MPVPVFIDTSALPRNLTRPGGPIEVLSEFAKAGTVYVFIPEVCCKEWTAHVAEATKKNLADCSKAISDAQRGPMELPAGLLKSFDDFKGFLDGVMPDIAKAAEAATSRLLETMKADVVPISSEHGAAVMNDYFDGKPPFRGPREREDIPDGFILQALKDLRKSTEGPIVVVAKDKRLLHAMGALDGVLAFEDLKDALQAEPIVKLRRETEREARWNQWLELFAEKLSDATPLVVPKLKSRIEAELAYEHIESNLIPSDDNRAVITMTEAPADLELDWSEAEMLGAGWISVPYRGTCTVLADFPIFRGDAYHQPDWVSVSYGDPEKDHSFEAQAHFVIEVTGTASVQFDENDIDTKEMSEPVNIELDALEIQVLDHE